MTNTDGSAVVSRKGTAALVSGNRCSPLAGDYSEAEFLNFLIEILIISLLYSGFLPSRE